ncbi:MAG TPA: hypothetical protein DDX14_04505, partial [Cyanobacteria bacterium UBA9579]|nr:hypothetical protein [Cyanobacteria bacterium UBA9579]
MKKTLIILGLLVFATQTAQSQVVDTFGVPVPSVRVNVPAPTFSVPTYGYYGTFPQYGVQASPIVTPQAFGARQFPTPGTTFTPQQPTIIQPGIGVLQPGFGQLGQPTFQP